MKNCIAILLGTLICTALYAQSPHAFKYQTILRDNSNALIINQPVGILVTILSGSTTGAVVYQETHAVGTNDYGLVNLSIGGGTPVSGFLFTDIDLGSNSHFLQIDIDVTGGSSYQFLGSTQLLSVPYALHAETVTHKDDADADPATSEGIFVFCNTYFLF